MFRATSSHQQSSAYLTKGILQLDKPFGQTGQTLMACTVAVLKTLDSLWLSLKQGSSDFSLVL